MQRVYISPSCQEKNVGWGTYNEEVEMNKIADKLISILEKSGIECERNNKNDTLTYVVQKANAFKPDLHVALHSNGFNQNVRGFEIWHNKEGEVPSAMMLEELAKVIPATNRGLKTGNLYEVNTTKHPTMLIEYDFHDTEGGATFIQQNIDMLAETTAKAICKYLVVDVKIETQEHWADKAFERLQDKGIEIHEKRFDDYLTRGEFFSLLDRLLEHV